MARILYHIIKKEISHQGELAEISERIPSIAKRCTGICIPNFFHFDQYSKNDAPKIESAINFNNKKDIPVNIQAQHVPLINRSPVFLVFNVDLMSNYINGFVRDRSLVFTTPYTVFIYLRLEV